VLAIFNVMLNVVILKFAMLSVAILNVILSVIIKSVFMLSATFLYRYTKCCCSDISETVIKPTQTRYQVSSEQ
jgi:hypothetical protein